MGQPRPLLRLFSVFSNKHCPIYTTNLCEKYHVHPVFSAGIRTHDLRNMSLLPQPLDQGSRPIINLLFKFDTPEMACSIDKKMEWNGSSSTRIFQSSFIHSAKSVNSAIAAIKILRLHFYRPPPLPFRLK